MLQIQELVNDIHNSIQGTDGFDKIMHSFIIGVCFGRAFIQSSEKLQDILKIINSLRMMVDAKIFDEMDLFTIYNKAALHGDDIRELYYQMQYSDEIQQETQRFYFPSKQRQQTIQQGQFELEAIEQTNDYKNIFKQQQEEKSKSNDSNLLSLEEEIPQDKNLIEESQFQLQQAIEIECKICWESSPLNEMKILNCDHIFHFSCLNQFCQTQIQAQSWPLLCPTENCKTRIDFSFLIQLFDSLDKNQFQKINFKKYIEQHSEEVNFQYIQISCCPTHDCNYYFIAENQSYFDCPLCKKIYCLNCKIEYHHGFSCEEYKNQIKEEQERALDDQFLNFARGSKFKQCPQCKVWVERSQGCDHMTCRCKFEFCYACGGVYKQCDCRR